MTKVIGASAGVLRTSAYIASGKDVMDDTGLTDMALGLGFGIAVARNKPVLKEKISPPEAKQTVSGKKWNNYFKEEYGAGNVQWKPNSFEDIINNPQRLYGSTPKEIRYMIGDNWFFNPHGSNGLGWEFYSSEGRNFNYAGGGIHGGLYYGYATGPTGRIKIVDDSYIHTPDDKAIIIERDK